MSFSRKSRFWLFLILMIAGFSVFGVLALKRYEMFSRYWFLAAIPAVGLSAFGFWCGTSTRAVHWRFFAAFLACGMLYLFAVPMLQVSDEVQHYLRSYEVATFGQPQALGENDVGDYMAANLIPAAFSSPEKTSYGDILGAWEERIDPKVLVPYSFPGAALYSPVTYLPQAVGIGVARLFTDRAVALLYAGRISNLVIVALLCTLAVKCFPTDKKLLSLLLMVPIYVHKAGSMSADGLTIAVVALFVSYVMYLQYRTSGRLKNLQLLPLYVLVFMLSQCKIVYLPVCLAFFILAPSRFESMRRYGLNLAALVLLAVGAGFGWLTISGSYLRVGYETSSVQIASILTNPLGYVTVLLRTIKLQGATLVKQMIGIGMGVGGVQNSRVLTLGYLGLILLTAFFSKGAQRRIRQKRDVWLLLVAALGVALLTCTALYVQWTDPGFGTIMGLQGRYFLPVLLLASVAVSQIASLDRIRRKPPEQALLILALGVNLVCVVSCFGYGLCL